MDCRGYAITTPLCTPGGHATGLPLAFRSTLDSSRPNAVAATSGRGTETAGFFGPSSERSTRKVVVGTLSGQFFGAFFLFVLVFVVNV